MDKKCPHSPKDGWHCHSCVKKLVVSFLERVTKNTDKPVDSDRWRLSIGMAVYQARIKARLTQKQLARNIGVEQNAICRAENGQSFSPDLLKRIAAVLRLDFCDLLLPQET